MAETENPIARDGKPGCPVTVHDGPYSTRCGAGASVSRCAHHGEFETTPAKEEPIDGAILAHFNMKVDDLIDEVFEGINDYQDRHPEITDDIAKQVLETRACDMAEGYVNWIEDGDGEWNGDRG